MRLLEILLILLLVSSNIWAAEETLVEKNIQIQWDEPDYSIIQTKKKRKRKSKRYKVILNGKVDPGVRVRLGKKITWVKNKKVRSLSIKKFRLKGHKVIKIKKSGAFRITLKFPDSGSLQIPLYLKVNGKKQSQLLVTKMDKGKLTLNSDKNDKVVSNRCHKCIWLGVGFGILSYQQDPPLNLKPVEYGSMTLPNVSFRGNYTITPKWGFRGDLHQQSGDDLESGSSSSITVSSTTVSWMHFGFEAEYLNFNKRKWWGYSVEPSLLMGVQYQDMPFVRVTTSPNFTIDSFKFASASFGGMALFNVSKKWQFESFIRVQVALSGAGDVKLKSGFAFDGSIAALYNWKKNWKLGIFWNGQSHSYKYELAGNSGSYALLSSKIDFSLGYSF